jgi:ABC-type branched-subunit amino acid transport system substrate-binding protein
MITSIQWLRQWRNIVIVLIASVICGCAVADDLLIGQVAPLSGTLAPTGNQMVLGAKIYFDAVNDNGGIYGRKIRHVVKDDGYQTPETVRLVKELTDNDKVLALIGSSGSAHLATVMKEKILSNGGIVMMSPYTGSTGLREPFALAKNFFHIRASYDDEADGIVNQIMALHLDRIAVFYQDDAFGKGGLSGVVAALERRGKTIVATGSYAANSPADSGVENAVKIIAAAKPSAVIMWSTNAYTAAFIKKIRPVSSISQFMNVSVVDANSIYALAGADLARGVGIAQVMPFPYANSYPVITEYLAALKKYGAGASESYTGLEEFIGAKVLVEGIRRAGSNPTRERIYKALETMNNYDAGGFPVHFSSVSHAGSNFVEVTVIGKNGKLMR